MMKCPNCGSTAQIKLLDTIEAGNRIVERYSCGCGASTTRHLELITTTCYSSNGTIISGFSHRKKKKKGLTKALPHVIIQIQRNERK